MLTVIFWFLVFCFICAAITLALVVLTTQIKETLRRLISPTPEEKAEMLASLRTFGYGVVGFFIVLAGCTIVLVVGGILYACI